MSAHARQRKLLVRLRQVADCVTCIYRVEQIVFHNCASRKSTVLDNRRCAVQLKRCRVSFPSGAVIAAKNGESSERASERTFFRSLDPPFFSSLTKINACERGVGRLSMLLAAVPSPPRNIEWFCRERRAIFIKPVPLLS